MKNKIISIAKSLFPGHDQEIDELMPFFEYRKIKAGELLIEEGESYAYVGFVLKGALRKFYRNNSKDGQTLWFSFEGSVIADINSILHDKPAIYCIQALENTELMVLPSCYLESLCERFSFLKDFCPQQLERAYTKELEHLVISAAFSAEIRYVKILEQQPDIIVRIPGHYIASYLGIRPESLSRIRKHLAG